MPTHRGPRSDPRHVFINVPFDERYEPLLLALVLALLARGLVPRSVVEVPPNRDRLLRLTDLIAQCGFSLHDLSRVTLSKSPYRVPRFNMPFEAGLAVAISRYTAISNCGATWGGKSFTSSDTITSASAKGAAANT